jgi:hypothetical protein
MTNHIENLKKVSLSIKVCDGKGNILVSEPRSFSFIYGAAGGGLCSLEIALNEHLAGDNVCVTLARAEMGEVCGHLLQPLRMALDLPTMPDQLSLDITITDIGVAENHEIVQAIAKSIGGGSCHGDCSSGCC